MTEFGKWLLKQRNLKDFTQGELAARLGMHVRSITQWELGRGLPNRNNLRRIAHFFDVDPESLTAAVFRKSGKYPDTPPSGTTGLQLPPLLGDRINRLACAVGMEPVEWIERAADFLESQASGISALIPPRPEPTYQKLVGDLNSRPESGSGVGRPLAHTR